MISKHASRIAVTVLIGAALFIVAKVLSGLLVAGVVPSLLTHQAVELVLSLLAIGILGKWQFADYGFRLPKVEGFSCGVLVKWGLAALLAIGMGAVATIAIVLTGAGGNPIVKQLSLPQIVLFIWVFSSTIEEIFTRGFIQGHLSPLDEVEVNLLICRVSAPTLVSALFFGAMHLVLFFAGADLTTIVITVIFTFSLGLLAGHYRAKSGSLVPAVLLHMLGNVGGVVGGILVTIATMAITGHLPTP